MFSKAVSSLFKAAVLCSLLSHAEAQWVGVGKGPDNPTPYYPKMMGFYGFSGWWVYANPDGKLVICPTFDIRSGGAVQLTQEDIWYQPSEDGIDAPHVTIGFNNYPLWLRYGYGAGIGPKWIPDGVWSYRVLYEDGSAVKIRGVPLAGAAEGTSPGAGYQYNMIVNNIPLNDITEDEFFYELMDQNGGIVAKFRVELPKCGSCDSTMCDVEAGIGSVDFRIPVGKSTPRSGASARACRLIFHQDNVTQIDKGSLVLSGASDPSVVPAYDNGGHLQSIKVGGMFTRIDWQGPGTSPTGVTITTSSDWQNPGTTVVRTVTITAKVDSATTPYLEFNEVAGATSNITTYRNEAAGVWTMDTENGARRETRSTTESGTERVVRTTVSERVSMTPATYSKVSDDAVIYQPGTNGWEKSSTVTDPDGLDLVTSRTYYQAGEDTSPDGSSSSAGVGRLKQVQHPTGEIETHYYVKYSGGSLFDSAHVVRKAFADSQDSKEITTESANGLSTETGRGLIVTRVTEKVDTQVVSQVETCRENVITPGFSGYVTETRIYSSPNEYTSTFTFASDGDDDSTTVVNPDGTASISTRVIDSETGYTTTTNLNGYVHDDPQNGIPRMVLVTMDESVVDGYGEEIATNSYRYKDGEKILVSRKLATNFDARHRATRWEHFTETSSEPVFVTEREYGCCGIVRELDQSGINTFYAYDAQKRQIMTNRNNVTTETVRLGLTTRVHRYPQTVAAGSYLTQLGLASSANEISRTVSDVNGNSRSEWSRSPQDGSMVETTTTTTYNIGGGIGRRVVTRPPVTTDDGGVVPEQIADYYLDGSSATTTGNLSPNRASHYSANSTGIVTSSSFLDGSAERETTLSQQDWAGRLVRITYASDVDGVGGNDFVSSSFNSKGQLEMTIDPDGVNQLFGYNLRGEKTITAIDVNGNQAIDFTVDRVSSSETDLVNRRDGEWVMRTTQKAWLDPGSDTGTAIAYSDVSLDGLRRWSIQNPSVQNQETTYVTTPGAGGNRAQLITHPDGTSQTSQYVSGLVDTVISRDSEGIQIFQLNTDHDILNRPSSVTDTRTGTSNLYYVNDVTDVVNRTMDEISRETILAYDHRGRAKTTNLPDTLNESGATIDNLSETFYFPDGSVRERTGDGGYRTTQAYDYARRVSTMTTYGTETAVTRWIYDLDRGFLTGKRYNSPTLGSGKGPSYTYTAAGRLKTRIQTRLVSGNPLESTYTYGIADGSSLADLDQIEHSDGTPAFTVSTRDRLGRPLEIVDDAAGTRSLKYTRHGAVGEETISSGILAGQKLDYGFDSILRLHAKGVSFGSQALGDAIIQYGASGAVRSVSGNGNTATYFYHPQKRTLDTLTYTKVGDTAPLLQSLRKHDEVNRLTRITAHAHDSGVQKPIDHHAYEYDDIDRIRKHTGIGGAFWHYGYNAVGEVTAASMKLPGGASDFNGRSYRYHFDGIGNRTAVAQSREGATPHRVFSYTPDVLNQYSNASHPDFLDVAGLAAPAASVTVNGQSVTRQGGYFSKELSEDNSTSPQWIDVAVTDGATTTDGSLPLPAASVTPTYDDDGNLTFDGLWHYIWDAGNCLIGCESSAASVSAGAPYIREVHDYDFNGRRIRTSVFTASGATDPAFQTLFVFDGWKCVAELDALSSNQAVKKYTWGLDLANSLEDESTGNVGALLWLVDTESGKTHVHLYDKNGNVTGLLDTTTRKRSARYEYDAFGQLIVCYGPYAKSNPFTFSTKFTDLLTGLCYYGRRWYFPRDGRWTSRDPIGERGGVNLHGFVDNNPACRIDRLGMDIANCNIDELLKSKNITGYAKTYAPDNSIRYSGAVTSVDGLESEILQRLIGSSRVFFFKNQKDLEKHIAARIRVVGGARALAVGLQFRGNDPIYNKKIFNVVNGNLKAFPGVPGEDAWGDMLSQPDKYAVACGAAAAALLNGFGPSAPCPVSDSLDWIPGDYGYITNKNWDRKTVTHEGQNMFYIGSKQFYGHASGVRIQTGNAWWDHVNTFSNPNGASLDSERNFVTEGIQKMGFRPGKSYTPIDEASKFRR